MTQAPNPIHIREFRNLLPIGFVVALGFGLVVPVLPLFAESFNVGLALLGLVQFVFGLTRFSFGLASGLAVDRFGERASTVTGILIVAASSYAAGFSQNFAQLVFARGFGGVGSALFIAGLMNRVLKVVPPAAMGRATGIWRTSFLVGIGIGPALGGVLGEYLGIRAPFHIYATGLLVAAAVAWLAMAGRGVRETDERKRSPVEALRAAVPLFRDTRYVVALLVTLAGWWTLSGPAQFMGALFAKNQLGFTPAQIGYAVTLLAVGEIIVVLLVAGPAADRFGRKAVLVPALTISVVATALIGQVQPDLWWGYYVLMLAMGAGVAAGSTAAGGLLADAIPKGGSGTAVSVNQMAGDLGYMVAPSAMGAVSAGAGFGVGYLVGAIPATVALLAALKLRREDVPVGEVPRPGAETEQPVEPVG
ncbi:MAG: MFS transporter [Actinobacteria bacterium]|nr:MFS transporter [Actinomycetota bacterium]